MHFSSILEASSALEVENELGEKLLPEAHFILVFVSVVLELSYSWVPILASALSECDLRQVAFPYL